MLKDELKWVTFSATGYTNLQSILVSSTYKVLEIVFFVTGDTLLQGSDMIPLLIQSIEKASNQSTQVALVTEAVSAANILVRLSLVDINAGKQACIKTA